MKKWVFLSCVLAALLLAAGFLPLVAPDLPENAPVVPAAVDRAGVYYREGYLYVNIGQIAEGLTGSAAVWNGKGFAISFPLPELIKNIKEVAVDFLDEFFGTDHGQITGETDLAKAEGAVVGLALAQDGNVYISQES